MLIKTLILAALLATGQGQQVPYAQNVCNQIMENGFKREVCHKMIDKRIDYEDMGRDITNLQKYLDELECRTVFHANLEFHESCNNKKSCPEKLVLAELENTCLTAYPEQHELLRKQYVNIYYKSYLDYQSLSNE